MHQQSAGYMHAEFGEKRTFPPRPVNRERVPLGHFPRPDVSPLLLECLGRSPLQASNNI